MTGRDPPTPKLDLCKILSCHFLIFSLGKQRPRLINIPPPTLSHSRKLMGLVIILVKMGRYYYQLLN